MVAFIVADHHIGHRPTKLAVQKNKSSPSLKLGERSRGEMIRTSDPHVPNVVR
jgi:hypothetical protein